MPDAPLLKLNIDTDGSSALFQQIYDELRLRIVTKQLVPGERLPPTRKLADELAISRTTIVTAYDQLIAEGFVESRAGSGVYVSDIGEVELLPANPPLANVELSPIPLQTGAAPFSPGQPDMRLFPYQQWASCVARVARKDAKALVMNSDPFGNVDLRIEICRYLSEWRGIKATPQQILITAGSGEALELCIRTLTNSSDTIALENPGYPPLYAFAKSLGLNIFTMEVDEQGATLPAPDHCNQAPKLAILTPSSQYPLGGSMPQSRRNEFLAWAEASNSWIIEDDYDSEFRYAGRPYPALASLNSKERTLYIGSFSKIFSNGVRMGFVVLPPSLIPKLGKTIRLYGSKASIMPQQPLAYFMKSGEFYRHIRRVRRIYSERRQALIQMLETSLGNIATFEDHCAGMQIAIKLPPEYNDKQLSKAALSKGIFCPPLSDYYSSSHSQNGLLLGFCGFTIEEMQAAMETLSSIIQEMA